MSLDKNFPECLQSALQFFPHITLKTKQVECLEYIFEIGGDAILNLPTGYGKNLIAVLVPLLLRAKYSISRGSILLLSPLNIIQRDQLQKLHGTDILSCRLEVGGRCLYTTNETEDFDLQEATASVEKLHFKDDRDLQLKCDQDMKLVSEGYFHIVHCHPEAILVSEEGQSLLDNPIFRENVLAVAVDECHKVEDWGRDFRKAFAKLHTLSSFFPSIPHMALSGTLTKEQLKSLPRILGLEDPVLFQSNPDRPNIYLDLIRKPPGQSKYDSYESVFMKECQHLYSNPETYPVTLMYLPLEWCGEATAYCMDLFGGCDHVSIDNSYFATIFSRQDTDVIEAVIKELKKENPRIRLIFCTSAIGMGFDTPTVTRVIHGRPPRNLSDYFQEISRAGRRSQPSNAILYYNNSDIGTHLPGIKQDIILYCQSTIQCLREIILNNFSFSKSITSPKGCLCCCHCKKHCQCQKCTDSLT